MFYAAKLSIFFINSKKNNTFLELIPQKAKLFGNKFSKLLKKLAKS